MKYSPYSLLVLLFLLFIFENSYSQGGTCSGIEPFCAGEQALIFPNCNDTDSACNSDAEPGPDYGCLFDQPYPAWFYLQIAQAGVLNFDIIQNTAFDGDGNPIGTGLDVDFIAWGPFAEGDNLCDYNQLQSFNEIGCSFSALPIESFTIPNGQPGEIYVLVITNYSQDAGFIQLVQTNVDASGAGITDCSIISPSEGCEGDTITLDGTTAGATNYEWEYNDELGGGFVTIFNGMFPTIDVTLAGLYQVTILPTNLIIPFEVILNPNPVIAAPPLNFSSCDVNQFNLEDNNPVVLGTQNGLDFVISYYLDVTDANVGNPANAINPANAHIIAAPPTETIYVRIADIASNTCYAIDQFTINFSEVSIGVMTDVGICDPDGNGQVDLDLPLLKNLQALGVLDPAFFTVSYHGSQVDADTDIGAYPNPYTVTGPTETIFVRVENNATPTCFATDSFLVTIVTPQIASPPNDLFQCDNGTNTGIFDLTVNTPVVLGTQNPADFLITYHNTAPDADSGVAPIAAPDVYPITGTMEEIFVRIEGEGVVEDLTFLEDFGTGVGRVTHPYTSLGFNPTTTLTPNQYAVTNNSTGLNDGWHQAMEDHTGDTNGRMILFDISEDPMESELYRRDIAVTANTELVFDFAMTTLYDIDTNICSDNGIPSRLIYQIEDTAGTVLATNTTGDVVNESNPNWIIYSLDFNSGANTIVQIVFINDIFGSCGNDLAIDDIKIFKTENCFDTASFFIDFSPISIGVMTDVEICDPDGNGQIDLDLPLLKDAEALNGLDPLLYTVSYYGSQVDADTNVGAYPNPYTVVAPSEIIFVRVENIANIACFETDSFLITLALSPIAILPTLYILCDEFPNDGYAEFDLTTKDIEITGGDPNTVITYHLTEPDADANNNPILTPATFINTIPSFQILYPRVENVNNVNCYNTTELVLQVDQAPAITDPITDYFLCDDNDDEVEVFDLLSKDLEILNTQLGVALEYYTTQADAEAQPPTNIIPNPGTYSNILNPQPIWVRAENSAGCITVLNFNLIVGEAPDFTIVPVFEQCDDEVQDGFASFYLNTQNATIVAGDTNLSVTYYETQLDADGNINPLTIPYTNTINPEMIFVRIENNTTGCYDTFTMDLVVVPKPDIFMPDPLEYCDPDNDGFGEFTLTDADSQVTGGIPTGNLQVSYHYLLEDAQNGVNPLSSPYLNDVPFNQTVFVRLLDQTTGCYGTTTLELIVLESPQIIQPMDLELCDEDGDGITVFDLTVRESELLNGLDPLLYTITYYEDAGLTIPIVNPVAYVNIPPSPQTIYIVVEDIANECKSETILLLWVYIPPVLVAPLPYDLCDVTDIIGPDDEFEPFDLESRTTEITGGDLTISVTYHETQAEADAGTNALLSPYINTANPQTIFLRAENTNGDNDLTCFVSLGVTLDLVVNPLPSPITPTPLEVCDIDNDGISEFMLTDKDLEIIGGEPGVVVTYHETLLNAESDIFALTSPYTNIDTYVQVVYVRAVYPSPPLGTGTGCFRIVELELIANPTPIISLDLPDLVLCADDDFTVFDLTEQAEAIYGSQDPLAYVLTYYISLADAEAGINAIANPTAFPNTSNPQTIWVRLEDDTTACIKVGSFELVVELVPIFTLVPTFEQCDDQVQDGFTSFDLNLQNATIIGGDLSLGVTYYATQIDADAASNPLAIPYTNTINPETIYVRIESNITGCHATFPMDLVVVPLPDIVMPDPLEYCDPDNDGFGEFMLTDADLDITGGVPIGNLQVSYHYLLEDAQNGVLPLPTAVFYLNDVPFLQTVYVRLVDQTTGCYNITTLDLIVLDSPQIISPADMTLCDDDGDGIEVFDLTLSEPELLSIADPAGGPYSITYYEDAALTISIANPTAYSNIPPSPQTVYIVVESIPNGCRSETTLVLWVAAAPTIFPPTALELCDIITQDDGFEPFDLESKTDEITGGNLTIDVTYYETQTDADAGTNALLSPYINTANPQTIFIRAEDLDTSCIVSQGITLSLVVNPLPSPVTPTPLEVCDVDNDGFASFMLTDKDTEIIGGEPGVLVSYYETYLDAEAGIFALTSPYINIVTPSQIIYTRAEFPLPPVGTGTGCFRIVELELIVNPTPIIPLDIPALVVCDDDGDGFSIFDLTEASSAIYGSQDPLDYTLSYYISESDAIGSTNPIANPTAFANTSNPQTIWVRLEDNTTGCPKIGSFDIRSELGPLVIQPTPLTSCDDLGEPNDGLTLFDLTLKNAEITGGALGVRVDYYETLAEAEADTNVIDPDTAYQNTSNPQTIWVRVTDINTFCFNTSVYLTLRVAANPDPEDPDPIILCDVNNPGDEQEVFDLTIREPQILDGETWDVSYYTSYQDAIDNNAQILLPTAYTNVINPELVYVRVSIDLLDATACFEIVALELIVNPLPDATAVITPYIICEIPGDGSAIFDLTTKIDEILNGQDPTIFRVLFYESQAEADLMINEIQNPVTYINTSNPQRIYVVILNTDTDCFVSTQSFDIEEREGAVANPPDPYAICDYWNENDGIAEFDLLNQDLLDEILGAQDPLVYQLDFYGTLENAELEVSPLPATYVNIINPQVIYARVTNINTECYDITEVILKVELIPEFALDEFYRLCVDAFGNPIPAEEGSASPPVIDTELDPSIYMFEWQLDAEVLLGEIGASITVLEEGVYTVTVTEILTGCMSSATTTVITSSPPLIYSAEVTDAFASEHTITATADGIGDYEFQLDDNPFQESGVFLDVAPGNHLITIKDINGCGSVTVAVGVIDYPQFMTPNEDGYHDTWNIIGIANGDPTAKIYIFDRYGKLLKQLSTLSDGWDGSYNGNPMPSSDYWFRVEYTENDTKKEFSGHFTLKR